MKNLVLLIFIVTGVFKGYSQAVYQTTGLGSFWSDPNSWVYVSGTPVGTVPTATDNVIVNHGIAINSLVTANDVTLNANLSVSQNAQFNSVTITGSSSVAIISDNTTLTINGSTTINGNNSFTGGSITRVVQFAGDVTVINGASLSILQVTINQNTSSSFTLQGTMQMAGSAGYSLSLGKVAISNTGIWMPSASVIANAVSLTLTDGALIDSFGGATGGFLVSGDLTVLKATAGSVSTLGNCYINIGGNTKIAGTLYFSKLNSGTKTFGGTITNSAHAEFSNPLGENITLNCNIVNDGVWLPPLSGTGTYLINTAGTFSYSGSNPIGMAQLSITANAIVTNNGQLLIKPASGSSITLSSVGSQFVNGSNSYLQLGGFSTSISIISGTLDFSSFTNEVDYASTGSQDIYPTTYSKLSLSNAGNRYLISNISVKNQLTLSSNVILDDLGFPITGSASLVMQGSSKIRTARATFPALSGLTNSFGANTTIELYAAFTQTLASSAIFPYQNITVNQAVPGQCDLSNVNLIGGNLTLLNTGSSLQNTPAIVIAGTFKVANQSSTVISQQLTTGSFQLAGGTLSIGNNVSITINGNNGSWLNDSGSISFSSTSSVVFNTGVNQQIGGNQNTIFRNLTINNANNVSLLRDINVFDLILTSGSLITGTNTISIGTNSASLGTVTRVAGFVDGNLKKYFGTGASACTHCDVTFEVGTGNIYSRLTLSNASISGGAVTVSATGTDHPLIDNSLINSSLSVNRYWTISNAGASITSYTPVFSYTSTDLDVGANPANFYLLRYNSSSFNWSTAATSPNTTPTSSIFVSGSAINSVPLNTTSIQFQIGEPIALSVSQITNRLSGTQNWGALSTWMQKRTGDISFTAGNSSIIGSSTLFLSELQVGDVLVIWNSNNGNSSGTVIGTIQNIVDNTNLVLTSGSPITSAGGGLGAGYASFGREKIPTLTDAVGIGTVLNNVSSDIQINITNASCYSLTLESTTSSSQSVTHLANNAITIKAGVLIKHPISTFTTNNWNINSGVASCGALTIGSGALGAVSLSKISKVTLTNGSLTAANILFNTGAGVGSEVTAVLDNGASGTINLSGSFVFQGNQRATLVAASSGTSTIRFNGSLAQFINGPSNSLSSWVYGTIIADNTSTSGVTNQLVLDASNNFKGDLKILNGTLTTAYLINGGAAQLFQIGPGATFVTNGTVMNLSGFGTYDCGITGSLGTFNCAVTSSTNLLNVNYGHLILSGGHYYTLPAGSVNVVGNLSIINNSNLLGNSTFITNDLTIGGNLNIYSGSTLNTNNNNNPGTSNILNINVGSDWNNNGVFVPTNSQVKFIGSNSVQPQKIQGTTIDVFWNITVNRTQPTYSVQLEKPISVSNVLNLTNGELNLNGFDLTINNQNTNAVLRTSGYIKSEVASYPYSNIIWNSNAATGNYTFPFGKSPSEYIPVSVNITTAGAGLPSSISIATYGTVPSNTPYPNTVTNVSTSGLDNSAHVIDRFWIIKPIGYSSYPVSDITIRATNSEVGTITNLVAQQWSEGNFWKDPLLTQSTTGNSVTIQGTSTNGIWTAIGDGQVLPVQLIYFKGEINDDGTLLQWSTASEHNFDYFEVEKSIDGIHFNSLVKIKGFGQGNSQNLYSYTDFSEFEGISYYRLKQVDTDQNYVYSELISVETVSVKGSVLFPNPADRHNPIYLIEDNDILSIRLIDYLGIDNYKITVENMGSRYKLIVDDQIKPGLYLLVINLRNKRSVLKIIIN